MNTLINILVTFALLFWLTMFMMSPMMFDAPGSMNDKKHLVTVMLILSYPIGIALLYWITGARYFGVSGFTLTWVNSAVVFTGFFVFGYFQILYNLQKGIANSGYSVAGGSVYYDAELVDHADSESFSVFSDEEQYRFSSKDYARDEHRFYYRGKVVEGVEVENIHPKRINGTTYWFNDSQVVYDDRILPGADPANFSGFDELSGWAYSVKGEQYAVYSYGSPLPAVDKATFTPLNDFIAKDKNRIFNNEQPILSEADAESFELLEDHGFGRDKKHVYYLGTVRPFAIDGADPASFQVLDGRYLKDKNSVYHITQNKTIETVDRADTESFEVTQYDEATTSEARDVNYLYNDGKIVGMRN
jgi:hypothetical protein